MGRRSDNIPDGFDALIARGDERHPGAGGPEVIWGVRNRLVHAPKARQPRMAPPKEWGESWQLSTWYLELVVLRRLSYDGKYGSRLRLDRYGADAEPVPWAAPTASTNGC